jgi:LysM repeat protein
VLTRYVAPAVFLIAVTAVVLVVRAALRSDGSRAATTSAATATRTAPARAAPAVSLAKRYYVIRSGDTLGGIAVRFSTTVAALLRLNPGIEPTALIPGRRVRVK